MSRLSRERLVRSGLVVALLSAVLVAMFGAGYRSSAAVLDTASDFLQRDQGLARVNWATGDVEAEAALELADDEELLDVVQVAPDVVHLVNTSTGYYWQMQTDTMRPELVTQDPTPDGARNHADGDGGQAYLLDGDTGRLTQLEDRDDGDAMGEIRLPADGRVDQFVVDGSGHAWALSVEQGELYLIDGVEVLAQHPVADPGEPAVLTLAGDQPIVYLHRRGIATMYDNEGELRRVYGLPTVANQLNLQVSIPGADARVLIIVVRRSGELVTVDFGNDEVSASRLHDRAGNRFGRPAVAGGLVYVPDYTGPHVLVLDLASLEQIREPVALPGGRDFAVVARDGRVWVNDPYGPLLSFDEDGRPRRLDKDDAADDATEPDQDALRPPETNQPGPKTPDIPRQEPETSGPPEAAEEPDEPAEVPDVVGMPHLEACGVLQEARLKCGFESRSDSTGDAGTVIETTPPAGAQLPANSQVTIVYYNGQNTVHEYLGRNILEACAEVQGPGQNFVCDPVEGVTGTREQCGIVYDQVPLEGTPYDVGLTVTPTFYSCNQDLPSYVGLNAQDACADIIARQFQCNAVQNLYSSTNVVVAQDQPAGRHELGSVITIHYSPWAIVDWWVHQWENGWVMAVGPPPAGVNGFQIGGAYASGTEIPGGAYHLNEFKCVAGSKQCRGLDTNVFYSNLPPGDPNVDPEFNQVTPWAVFMPCTGANRPVWRVWNGGGPRYYMFDFQDPKAPGYEPPPGLPLPKGNWDSELLGCVW